MKSTFVIHYSEVALKGKNRPEFARALRRSIGRTVAEDAGASIEQREGRFVLTTAVDPDTVATKLSRVFGVAWFARATITKPSYEDIKQSVLEETVPEADSSFRIVARRNDKSFPLGSMEIERRLGADVILRTGRRVDLSKPGQTIHVDVLHGSALVYSDRARGPGGLPIGTAGRVIHLFSGGIDSPVAAWLLMKRGCTPVYLHFYLAPTPASVLESKVLRLVKILSGYSGRSTMVLIPFAEYQLATLGAPGDLEPSLFRRFMRLTAEALAPRFGASAISTGDCLSQAASQTLWNLAVFDEDSQFPVLRPLLTYDKDEVIRLARSLGTYDLSVEEYKDCCSIITKHPRTKVKPEIISRYSDRFDFKGLVGNSILKGTLVTYSPSSDELKTSALSEVVAPRAGRSPSLVPRQNYKQG